MFSKRCKKCLITPQYPSARFDEQGVCNYCRGEKDTQVTVDLKKQYENLPRLRRDFEHTVQNINGEHYDCVVGISGGKDSVYLLWLLTHKYRLKCLAFTVDNGLLSSSAKKNISYAVNKLNVDHLFYRPAPSFYRKLYRHLLNNPGAAGYMETVCSVCSELFHSTAVKIAVKKHVPLVCFGYSPDQITRYFYEIPQSELRRSRIPQELWAEKFTDEDRHYFWDPSYYQVEEYPRVLFPFHVIDYPGVATITDFLHEKKLIKVSTPLLTNCHLSWLSVLLDLMKNGFNPLSNNYSELIRQGKARRWKWLIVFSLGETLLQAGVIKRKEIQTALDFLDVSIRHILS